jgi:hypothetical protein
MECPGHQATDECYDMLLQVDIRRDGSVSRESTLPCWAAVLPCWEVDGQPAIYIVGTRTKAQRGRRRSCIYFPSTRRRDCNVGSRYLGHARACLCVETQTRTRYLCCRGYTRRRWCTDGNRPVVGFVLPAPLRARHRMHSARRRNGTPLIRLLHMLHPILLIQLADIATRPGSWTGRWHDARRSQAQPT